MKHLTAFDNLEIAPEDLILISFPLEEEATSLFIDKKTRDEMNRKFPFARPMVVAKVGSGNATSPECRIKVKRGDFVFVNEAFIHSSTLLGMDEDRRWLNPVIVYGSAVVAKVVYGEEWEKTYDAIADKVEESIKLRDERMKKMNKQKEI